MREKGWRCLGYVAAVIIGAFPAFFVVFNAIFSDGSSTAERIVTFILTIFFYGILGMAFGFCSSAAWWKLGLWISLPAIVIVTWYSTRETGRLLLHVSYPVLAVGAASLGAGAGSWLRARQKSRAGS
jgi:lipoprotein signal peptidase